jgi:TM2 domain-containing membrane protein YozV
MYKIIGADGQPYGPVSADQIRRWLTENRVNALTLLQSEGSPEWKPMGSFPEFAADLNAVPPPVSNVPPPIGALASTIATRASNKVPAGVCGILLGGLGVHKFILGYTGAGLIMLLVGLVGGMLTCGVATGLVHLIGLIEGIIYLCKTDEEFVRVYVDGRREWF